MSWDEQPKIKYQSVFTIHTKDGILRRNARAVGRPNTQRGTPYCTVTLKGAEKIARDRNAAPCVIIETKTGYSIEKDILYHHTISHKIDE